jgi:hypothetical protein
VIASLLVGRAGILALAALTLGSVAACESSGDGTQTPAGGGGTGGHGASGTGGSGGGSGASGRGGAAGGVCPPPASCSNDISNAAYFSIAFNVTATGGSTGGVVLAQGGPCNAPFHYWQIQISPGRGFSFESELGHATPQVFLTSIPIDDGVTHSVNICRGPDRPGVFTFTDGLPSGIANAMGLFVDLEPLTVAHSPCPAFPPLNGTVTDVCLGPQ